MFSVQYFLGFFADELIDRGLSPNRVGYVYGVESLIYFLTVVVYPYLFESLPRKMTIVIAFFGFAIGHLIIGPS